MKRKLFALLAILAVGACSEGPVQPQFELAVSAPVAKAVIDGAGYQVIPAPASVKDGETVSNARIRVFQESQGVDLAGAGSFLVDLTEPGTWTNQNDLPGATAYAGPNQVDSWLIHLDRSSDGINTATITFDQDVVALITGIVRLRATDDLLGSPTTEYAFGQGRGFFDGDNADDQLTLSEDRRTLTVQMAVEGFKTDQIRVIFAAAAPAVDTDGDGVPDDQDTFPNDPTESSDRDGDGVGDNADAFPDDPNETTDTDGDGVGDNSDAFPNDPAESSDADGDGVGDNGDAFPNDPTETADSDGDGVGNNGDAFPNDPNETADTDGDGVGDNGDAFPTDPSESADNDGDGVGDNADRFDNSDTSSVVTILGMESGVPNRLLPNGATFADKIQLAIEENGIGGRAVSVVASLIAEWRFAGLISGRQAGALHAAFARAVNDQDKKPEEPGKPNKPDKPGKPGDAGNGGGNGGNGGNGGGRPDGPTRPRGGRGG